MGLGELGGSLKGCGRMRYCNCGSILWERFVETVVNLTWFFKSLLERHNFSRFLIFGNMIKNMIHFFK